MMDDDQKRRLRELSGALCERVLADADPANWSGQGKLPGDMSKEERGNDLWCRKQAAAVLMLYTTITKLIDPDDSPPPPAVEEDIEKMIERAEKEAARMIKELGLKRGH